MIIVAIDPSVTRTGICLNNIDGKPVCISIAKPKGSSDIHVLANIQHQVLDVVRTFSAPGTPELIVIEEAVAATGHGVQMNVLFLQGILRFAFLEYAPTTPVIDFHPSRRRKYACGNQKARDKDNVLLAAVEKAGPFVVSNNDEADAFWLWRAATDAYTAEPEDLTLYRQEVLAGIEWPRINGVSPTWTMPKKAKKAKA